MYKMKKNDSVGNTQEVHYSYRMYISKGNIYNSVSNGGSSVMCQLQPIVIFVLNILMILNFILLSVKNK